MSQNDWQTSKPLVLDTNTALSGLIGSGTRKLILEIDRALHYPEPSFEEPDSPVVEVVPYFDLEEIDRPAVPMALAMGDGEDADLTDAKEEHDHRRIDVAALDENGDVVVAVEADGSTTTSAVVPPPISTRWLPAIPRRRSGSRCPTPRPTRSSKRSTIPSRASPASRRRMPTARPPSCGNSTRLAVRTSTRWNRCERRLVATPRSGLDLKMGSCSATLGVCGAVNNIETTVGPPRKAPPVSVHNRPVRSIG